MSIKNKRKTIIPIIIVAWVIGVALITFPNPGEESMIMNMMNTDNYMEKTEDTYQYRIIEAGKIKPHGWIAEQLKNDLTKGYTGSFDEVHPTVTHDVFVKQNRFSKRKFSMRKEWWSGEHEGYWKDAVIRMAYLTDNDEYKKLAKDWIYDLMEADESGYIGIYSDENATGSRFNHKRGNGELWATSRMLMAMLAYYEYTGDKEVLNAVEKAVDLIIEHYNDENYFAVPSRGGGVSHGIGFFENLEWLYRITGDRKYKDFSLKLYHDFNTVPMRDDDMQTDKLLDEELKFDDHGAHVAEGLFVPQMIAALVQDEKHTEAAENVLKKLEFHTTPSGAMRSDEWVKGRPGTADERYEYCGIAEMVSPLNKMITFSGDLSLADRIELLTFNAGQGARLPILKALSYFTKDNRIKINHREIVRREAYNAAHFAAVCCVLNGGRLMPYYVEGMWMKETGNNGLTAVLYGPNTIQTEINNTPVKIIEETEYPFSDEVSFRLQPEQNVSFTLKLRKPFGCKNIELNIPDGARMQETEQAYKIDHDWKKGDVVEAKFNFDVKKIEQPESKSVDDDGIYVQRGPIVYALPFNHTMKKVREHGNSGFYSYKMIAKNKKEWNYKLNMNGPFDFTRKDSADLQHPWMEPVQAIKVWLIDKEDMSVPYELVPMGNTVFRRVTFSSI